MWGLMKWHLHRLLGTPPVFLLSPSVPAVTGLSFPRAGPSWHLFLSRPFISAQLWEFFIRSCPEQSQQCHMIVSLNQIESIIVQYSWRLWNEICVPETRGNIPELPCLCLCQVFAATYKDFSLTLSRFLKGLLPNSINKTVNVLCHGLTCCP